MKKAFLFFNGEILGEKDFFVDFIQKEKGDIFCADGGANICRDLGLLPKEIWGDLDSITEKNFEYFLKKEVKFKKFPKEKDSTDSELLLKYLKENKYDKIYCLGALRGEIDHELTNINLTFKYDNLYFLTEKEQIFKINKNYEFKDLKGEKISFIIFSDKLINLTLKGFKYEVQNLSLKRGDSRCMSNIISEKIATISFEDGKLLAIIKK